MERKEKQFEKEIETLEFQISDLQTSLHRNEQQANRREDNLRQEISDVQQVGLDFSVPFVTLVKFGPIENFSFCEFKKISWVIQFSFHLEQNIIATNFFVLLPINTFSLSR